MRFRFAMAFTVSALTVPTASLACGPIFPYAYLAFGRERDVLKLPEVSFYGELCRILKVDASQHIWSSDPYGQKDRTLEADAASLSEALKTAALSEQQVAEIVAKYRAARRPEARSDRFGDSLPREFALYAEGATHYHAGEYDQAIAKWKELLELPEDQRKNKSVWAAYMIGRALRDTDAAQAVVSFDQARTLAAEGFSDPLALAGESLGWKAYFENNAGNIASALELYAKQFADGYKNARSASSSLHMICAKAFDSTDALVACAANETARAVLTAWVISHPAYSESRKWVALLAGANIADLPQADLIAWIAYRSGDFDSAQKLLEAHSADTPYGNWVRSKLLLREGKVDEAFALLQQLAANDEIANIRPYQSGHYDGAPPHSSVDAELGVLLLGKQRYAESFERFIRAGFWLDAAYVGERVMTSEELKSYIDRHAKDPSMTALLQSWYHHMDLWDPLPSEGAQRNPSYLELTRYVLARRLARADQWADAQPYWPAPIAERAAQLVTLRSEGRANQPPATKQSTLEWFLGSKPNIMIDRDRAKKLYDAAVFTRENGMELLGTEVQPDWHVFGGWFELSSYYRPRTRWEGPNTPKFREDVALAKKEKLPDALERVLSASDDELQRLRDSAPTPNQRFHYRYTAADLMWQAAQNLPDNDIDTMRALYTGGGYLKNRDPKAANKFYRSLVWRNPNMPYAQNADRLRWFPEGPPE